jgi:DNA-binding NarL/FixJ family response regulator
MSRDLEPQKRTNLPVGRLDDEAIERYTEWREACVTVDDAYCEWLYASADDAPGAFAAYRAALDHEESLAVIYSAVIDRLRQGRPSYPEIAAEESASARQLLRVVIADRDGFARRMLQRALQEAGEVEMATAARDGREALELARRCLPDVLVLDIGVPPSGGIELIRKVVSIMPRIRIVTVSAGEDWDQAVLAALRAGAIGHIDKDTAPDQIARLVVLAARGETIVPGRLMSRLSASWRAAPPAADDRGAIA